MVELVPEGRSSGCLINISSGKYLLYGGSSRSQTFNDFWIGEINHNSLKWKKLEVENDDNKFNITPRYGSSIILLDNKCYIFGGQNINTEIFDQLITFDINIENNKISNLKNITNYPLDNRTTPNARNSHSAFKYSDTDFIIYGGGTLQGLLSDCYQFNVMSNKWKRLFLQTIDNSEMGGMCVYNNKLYIFGGRTLDDIINYTLVYNLANQDEQETQIQYTKYKNPMKICSFANVLIKNWFIIYGGINGEIFLNTLILVDLDSYKWYYYNKSTELNISGCICPMMTFDNKYLVIFGGSSLQYESNQSVVVLLEDLFKVENLKEF